MAFNELIKNFKKVRDYMREFYVYGFKSRSEYTWKSARSYDDERRRMESWLGEYMKFHQTDSGKNVFLSIDSRRVPHNPLYKAWKAKSFTDGDITLHFILFDILWNPEISLNLKEIMAQLDDYLSNFRNPRVFDESTLRKKLQEYTKIGIIVAEKRGRVAYYRSSSDTLTWNRDVDEALNFFAETAPCGVVGSFLLDKSKCSSSYFTFKHHYITSTMDNEILFLLFRAIHQRKFVDMKVINRHTGKESALQVLPLQIWSSVRNGRQYLMAYTPKYREISPYRIDSILEIQELDECKTFEELCDILRRMESQVWGVSTKGCHIVELKPEESNQPDDPSQYGLDESLEHIEFIICFSEDERAYILRRLEREKRCGTVTRLDRNHCFFQADVYDANEMIPWIRTFICRITAFRCSNQCVEQRFLDDMKAMYQIYEIHQTEEGEADVL